MQADSSLGQCSQFKCWILHASGQHDRLHNYQSQYGPSMAAFVLQGQEAATAQYCLEKALPPDLGDGVPEEFHNGVYISRLKPRSLC